MTTYYSFLWLLVIFNLLRAMCVETNRPGEQPRSACRALRPMLCANAALAHEMAPLTRTRARAAPPSPSIFVAVDPHEHRVLWDVVWLVTRLGHNFLEARGHLPSLDFRLFSAAPPSCRRPGPRPGGEGVFPQVTLTRRSHTNVRAQVSVVVFLAQGYVVSAQLALIRTVVISGVFAVVDALMKAILLSRLHLSLFIPVDPMETREQAHRKWGYWTAHTSVYVVVYGASGRRP